MLFYSFLLIIKGSPLTYLTDATINSIREGKRTFEGEELFDLNIHGTLLSVKRSDLRTHNFNGINLLGADYLKKALLVLTADYVNEVVKLERGKQ